MDEQLKSNLYSVLERIDRAAARVGAKVKLVAATKTVPAATVAELVSLGVTAVGENRVQEYLEKRDAVTGAEWHFIGTLQRNKAKYLVGSAALIQSVSSIELAREIDRLAAARGVIQPVLVELNASGEQTKTGAPMSEIDALIAETSKLPNIALKGLMAIPEKNAKDEVYREIRNIYERYRSDAFKTLSVGMSGDFERAIEFGSNTVRIGTAIFGPRKYSQKEA